MKYVNVYTLSKKFGCCVALDTFVYKIKLLTPFLMIFMYSTHTSYNNALYIE